MGHPGYLEGNKIEIAKPMEEINMTEDKKNNIYFFKLTLVTVRVMS